MPLGELTKPEVRALARKLGLATADKKDSQGICFVGKVGIKDFLLAELGSQPAGDIVDHTGAVVGRHDGALFYTIGQRHGLQVGGGLPYYVTGKSMPDNIVYVTTNLQDTALWKKSLRLTALHWINNAPASLNGLAVRTRYRAPLVEINNGQQSAADVWKLVLADEVRAITPGQSAVVYDGSRVLGGGIVA